MRRLTPLAAFLAAFCVLPSAFALEIHFSPEERLDAIEAAFIATAKHSIDLVGRHSKIGGMDGRYAHRAAGRRRFSEGVVSDPFLPFPGVAVREGSARSGHCRIDPLLSFLIGPGTEAAPTPAIEAVLAFRYAGPAHPFDDLFAAGKKDWVVVRGGGAIPADREPGDHGEPGFDLLPCFANS